jgi:hypothetical protein
MRNLWKAKENKRRRARGRPAFRGFREVGVDAAGGYGGWPSSRPRFGGAAALTSAAEAGFPCLSFFGTSELVPFPSPVLPRFAKTRHDSAREGHDFQSCR